MVGVSATVGQECFTVESVRGTCKLGRSAWLSNTGAAHASIASLTGYHVGIADVSEENNQRSFWRCY